MTTYRTDTRVESTSSEASLIINADDFGYFRCVSQGILRAARRGVVTATGILANGPPITDLWGQLQDVRSLDCGVHLNLTYGEPLSRGIRPLLSKWGGRFPGKAKVAVAVLSGQLALMHVAEEWRRQILTCAERGVTLHFLNSHEHIHMLPPLFRVATQLAEEFGISHVRYTRPEWVAPRNAPDWIRNAAVGCLGMFVRSGARSFRGIGFLGAGASGKLALTYFRATFPRLKPGRTYELMCHPGLFDAAEIRDPALLSYHNWEQELSVLESPEFDRLCRMHHIHLIGYRNLLSNHSE